jgi:hypothetical protein
MTDVIFQGRTWKGDGTGDFVFQKLDGIDGGAPMRGSSDDLPNSDGAVALAHVDRSALPLKFIGLMRAATDAEGKSMRRWFAALQSDGIPFELQYVESDGEVLTLTVTVNGVPYVEKWNERTAYVEVSLIAFDPVKYGAKHTAVTGLSQPGGGLEYPLHSPSGALSYGSVGELGRVTLYNNGTADVWPVVHVTGALTLGFFIQRLGSGEVVRYDRVVPAGTTVDIDFATGETLVDGISDASIYLTRSEFFPVRPGESFEVQFNAVSGSSGSPQMTITNGDGNR